MSENVHQLRKPLVLEFEAEMTRLGLSQNRVATRVGVSGAAISQWRHGKYTGDVPKLERAIRKWLNTEEEVEGRRMDEARLDVHMGLQVTGEISSLLATPRQRPTWCW